jgi:nuclear pore complex protein Nup98-Nup96
MPIASVAVFPVLRSTGYFTRPSIDELVERETGDPGYCSRVPNFIIGRAKYGQVRFLSDTDVRGLDLNEIVRFDRHCVTVYGDEANKTPIGHGLNKPAEVTLLLELMVCPEPRIFDGMLRCRTRKQGARFVSFNPVNGNWKFEVDHFSRFGFVDEEEEEEVVAMDDAVFRQPIAEERLKETRLQRDMKWSFHIHYLLILGLTPQRCKR